MELSSFRAIATSAVFADLQIAGQDRDPRRGHFEGSWLYRAMHRTRMIRRKSHRACRLLPPHESLASPDCKSRSFATMQDMIWRFGNSLQ